MDSAESIICNLIGNTCFERVQKDSLVSYFCIFWILWWQQSSDNVFRPFSLPSPCCIFWVKIENFHLVCCFEKQGCWCIFKILFMNNLRSSFYSYSCRIVNWDLRLLLAGVKIVWSSTCFCFSVAQFWHLLKNLWNGSKLDLHSLNISRLSCGALTSTRNLPWAYCLALCMHSN